MGHRMHKAVRREGAATPSPKTVSLGLWCPQRWPAIRRPFDDLRVYEGYAGYEVVAAA
jgi:hypothetical protein